MGSPWTVHARENLVLLNTHPLSAEEAADLAQRLYTAAKHIRRKQEDARRAKEPPPLPVLAELEVPLAAAAPPEPPPPPPAEGNGLL